MYGIDLNVFRKKELYRKHYALLMEPDVLPFDKNIFTSTPFDPK
jgi:hypothetical protein